MSKQTINVGVKAGDKSGDPLRTAFTKVNENFTELYAATGADVQIPPQTGNANKYLKTDGTTLSWSTVATQIQSDWTQATTSALDYIKNKPTLFSGSYTDLTSKPTLFSGSYTDLTSKPTIPTSFSSLVNGAHTLSLGSDSTVTFPNDVIFKSGSNNSLSIGYQYDPGTQGTNAVAIGAGAGSGTQGDYAVAFGTGAGQNNQGMGAVAIGYVAGGNYQNIGAVAVGQEAGTGGGASGGTYNPTGSTGTTLNLVAPGANNPVVPGMKVVGTGFTTQTVVSVNSATQVILSAPPNSTPSGTIQFIPAQGLFSIAIGFRAGGGNNTTTVPQANGTIVLNASNVALSGVAQQTDSFYVNPIRTDATPGNVLYYNTATKEVTYGSKYSLPTATTSVLGGVKVDGTSVTINGSGVISLNAGLSGSVTFKGGWNANTNTPTLADGTGTSGWMYIVTTGGTQNLGAGSVVYAASDLLIYDGSAWIQVAANNGVVSFNTRTGAVTLSSTDVTTALGYTPYNNTNPSGYTNNTGTVTSVSGTGTVSGLTLTGSVTTSGNLTLGGTLSLTSSNVTTALGFTPYNSTNPSNYITNSSLSVTTNTASGAGSLSYSAGVFTFTPAAAYSLPIATTSVLGGVKVDGTTITIASGVIAVSSALTSATQFKGNWDAGANTPTLSSSLPAGVAAGWEYIVSASGTRDIGNGSTSWSVGDLVIYDGAKWVRIPSGNNVVSFNTRQGAITLGSSDVTTALGFTPYNATNPTGYTTNTGTVTSAGLSLPSQFNVTTSTVTTSGTLTAAWNVQIANKVLAGPATGADAAPTFRALVAADIPSLSYAPTAGSSSITTLGTVATGTWNGSVIAGAYGGTGVANTGKTITLGGNLTTSGAFTTTLTATANTALTLPTTGTLVTLDGTETLTNKTLGATTISGHLIPNADVTYDLGSATYRFRDLYLSGSSIKLGGATLTASGSALAIPASSTLTTPIIATNITTASTTFALVNTTATTVNFAGAATTALNIGASTAPITGFAAIATTSSTAASIGYLGLPQSATATTASLAIGDAGKHIYVTTAGQTITIPANGTVAYPIGTTITFIAGASATTVSIAITTDTMRLAGGALTGTRTLAANGMATAVKVAATTWYINGTGLT